MGSTGRGGGAGGAGGGGGVTALRFSGGSPRFLVDSLLFSDMFDTQNNKSGCALANTTLEDWYDPQISNFMAAKSAPRLFSLAAESLQLLP